MRDRDEILKQTNDGLEIFNFYIPFNFKLKKNFLNPLYEDHIASCQIYYSTKTKCYMMHDFGNPDYCGDCFWFVAKLKGLNVRADFRQVLNIITSDLHLNLPSFASDDTSSHRVVHIKSPLIVNSVVKDKVKMKKNKIVPKVFTSMELNYWKKYGITLGILDKFNVISLAEFHSENNEGKPYILRSTPEKPIFGYKEDKYIKIYRPFDKIRFLYGGTMPDTYSFGIKQLPTRGDVLFITGGEKDTISLSAHGFNAICFNSETVKVPQSIIEMLSRRFRHICVMYDCDETGLKAMETTIADLREYSVVAVKLPLSGIKTEKDISDYFALGHTADELHLLIRKSIEPLYSQSLLLIKSCEMDFNNPPKQSKLVVSTEGVPLGSYDNLLCITGGEGTGKSNFVSSIISGTLLTEELAIPIDTLGFSVCPNYSEKAVLHFDTEQSEYQLYKNMNMTLHRARLDQMPSFYHSFYLTTLSRKERMQLIRDSMDLYHHHHGGIHLVVIDGIADLVKSANDETESIAVVEELYSLAGIYHTCIICVLHFVPNGIKLRGHIGSELQRKSAAILSVEKDEAPANSVVKALKVRDGNPLDVPMLLFKWDKQQNMHISAGKKSEEDKSRRKREELTVLARTLFSEQSFVSYKELTDYIISQTAVADRTAKDYIGFMLKNQIITKEATNRYSFKQ